MTEKGTRKSKDPRTKKSAIKKISSSRRQLDHYLIFTIKPWNGRRRRKGQKTPRNKVEAHTFVIPLPTFTRNAAASILKKRKKKKKMRAERWPSFLKSVNASLTSAADPLQPFFAFSGLEKRTLSPCARPRLHDQKSPQTNRHFHGYAQLPGLTND